MNRAKMIRRWLAALVALSLLGFGPVWPGEPQALYGQSPDAGAAARIPPKIDLRAAARVLVADETGLVLPLLGESGFADQVPAQKPEAAATRAATVKRAPDWSTVPPNAPRTTRTHKIAAYVALAILTVASMVLVVREVGKDDPVLTPGTPTRIP
jgi:hypothetical protein